MTDRWDPGAYARGARFVAELGEPVLRLLDPRPGERILDLGCGDGALTARIAEAGAEVVGVDSSAEQIVAAVKLGLDARVMDGGALDFAAEFDAVFSNAALHWMPQPDAVIAGVARALKPVGRFVGEFGGAGNVDAIRVALHARLAERGLDPAACDPWYFPSPEEYGGRLEARGFSVRYMELIPRPTPLPGDMSEWLAIFAQSFTAGLPEAERASFVAQVVDDLAPVLKAPDGSWSADYVRLRFAAFRG